MKCLTVMLFVIFGSFPCLAQNSKQYRACTAKAKTQTKMHVCANEEAERVDAGRNRIYRALLSKAASQPEAVAKIEAAEKAWLAYRDAYFAAMYPANDKQAAYGSIYPMEVDLVGAKLTRQHVADLDALLQRYSDVAQ